MRWAVFSYGEQAICSVYVRLCVGVGEGNGLVLWLGVRVCVSVWARGLCSVCRGLWLCAGGLDTNRVWVAREAKNFLPALTLAHVCDVTRFNFLNEKLSVSFHCALVCPFERLLHDVIEGMMLVLAD